MTEDATPLDQLTAALQAFVAATEDQAALVVGAVVVWEQVTYDGPDQLRAIRYAVPGDAYSMAGSIGLLSAGLELVTDDTLGGGNE